MKKEKKLPKKNAQVGLYLFCNKHKAYYKHDDLVKCKCDLKYKVKIHIPTTKRKYRCKTFDATTVEEAILKYNEFKMEFKKN